MNLSPEEKKILNQIVKITFKGNKNINKLILIVNIVNTNLMTLDVFIPSNSITQYLIDK